MEINSRGRIADWSCWVEEQIAADPLMLRAIGDRGSFAIVVTLLAGAIAGDGSTTLAAIEAVVVPRRLATARRVRALVDWLEGCGSLERIVDVADRRRRPLRPTGWLVEALRAALPDGSDSGDGDRRWAILVEALAAFVRAGAPLPPEIAAIAEHRGGYPLLLRLIGSARRSEGGVLLAPLSRKAVARRYGVSRAHVTALVAGMERMDRMERLPGGAIRIDDRFDTICLRCFRRHAAALGRLSAGERRSRVASADRLPPEIAKRA